MPNISSFVQVAPSRSGIVFIKERPVPLFWSYDATALSWMADFSWSFLSTKSAIILFKRAFSSRRTRSSSGSVGVASTVEAFLIVGEGSGRGGSAFRILETAAVPVLGCFGRQGFFVAAS